MLPVNWSDDALDDLAEIIAYVTDRNEASAQRLRDLITVDAERIPLYPYLHRPGRVGGTREAIVHPNYVIVYRVARDAVDILAVLHARQQYP